MSEQEAIARILAHEKLSINDVKSIMSLVRYRQERDERADYANTILPGAGDYLPAHWLHALVRADISEDEALLYLQRNKAFFGRLADLLPHLVRFFSVGVRATNLKGLISNFDQCHIDFFHTTASSRKDRQLREAKESLAKGSKLASDLALILEKAEQRCKYEFQRYYTIYYPARDGNRYLDDLQRLPVDLRTGSVGRGEALWH
jgi:hypothetical protein